MGTETAQNPTPITTPATDASPFHAIPGHETIQAAPKSVYQAGPSGAAHGKAGSMGSAAPEKSFIGENIDKLTEPIENYTPAGREAHPILSRLGDVTRGVKELLEGGQTPMGAKSGVLNNPATAFILPENQEMVGEGLAAKGEEELAQAARGEKGLANTAAKAEETAREYAPKVASHLAETGHNFLTGMLEDARAGFEATAPEGSTEAGFAKIPGYRKEGPAPELPKKPKAVTKPAKLKPPVEVNPEAEATKKAEDDLAAARANYVHDMEKNPTTLPKGTPVHEQVVYVDPNKVIAKVNPGGNTFDEPTVQKYQRMIRNGEDIPAARIEYGKTGDLRGYDGRHRVEAARREGAPVKLWTRREVEPGEAPPTTIGHEEPQVHELNGDETPESANGNIPESQQAATEEEGAYHPDLQALADKHGVTDDPYKISHGSSVITPDGKFIHGNSGDDPAFVNNTGAIQTRATFDNSGHTLNVTVPSTGVNPDQVDALKHATSQALGNGKSGKVVIHLADGTKYAERPNASAATIEPALKALGVHPNSYVGSQAEKLPVNSSHIQHWGYDPKADTLHVTFKDGGEYRMNGVSGQTWAALQKDTSPGKAFNRLVRGKYTGQKTK